MGNKLTNLTLYGWICFNWWSTILFQRYQVTFSMLEIYNEQVRDLLSKETPKGGLAVRQSPKEGSFYVQGLKKVPVQNYKEIEKRIEQGMKLRSHFQMFLKLWALRVTHKKLIYLIGTLWISWYFVLHSLLNKIIRDNDWFSVLKIYNHCILLNFLVFRNCQ